VILEISFYSKQCTYIKVLTFKFLCAAKMDPKMEKWNTHFRTPSRKPYYHSKMLCMLWKCKCTFLYALSFIWRISTINHTITTLVRFYKLTVIAFKTVRWRIYSFLNLAFEIVGTLKWNQWNSKSMSQFKYTPINIGSD
jgi:hypothetical protein